MTPISDSFEQPASHAEAPWTTPVRRAFPWLHLFRVLATVSLIRYGGVRDLSYANGPAWSDLIEGRAGELTSFLMYRALSRPSSTTNEQE
jgi:hypothetical protein